MAVIQSVVLQIEVNFVPEKEKKPCLQFTDTLFASSQGWNREHRVIKQSVCFKYINIQLYI